MKSGRPRQKNNRTKYINIRVTPTDKKKLRLTASRIGESQSKIITDLTGAILNPDIIQTEITWRNEKCIVIRRQNIK